MLDEARRKCQSGPPLAARAKPAVSPCFVPGCRHAVFQNVAERWCVGKSGRDWQGASAVRRRTRRRPAKATSRGRRRRPDRKARRRMNGFGLSRERFALLFSVMLVAAAGNTAMQSLLPAIGRELGVADIWVAVAFSLSAVVWVVMAPVLGAPRRPARPARADAARPLRLHRLDADLRRRARRSASPGWLGADRRLRRSSCSAARFYGAFGSASPPAVQAYVAARTEGAAADQRAGRASPPPSGSARSSARRSRRSSSSRRSACRRR